MLSRRFSRKTLARVYRIFERSGFAAIAIPAILPPAPMVAFLFAAGAMRFFSSHALLFGASGLAVFAASLLFTERRKAQCLQARLAQLLPTTAPRSGCPHVHKVLENGATTAYRHGEVNNEMRNTKRWILPVLGTVLLSMATALPAFAQDGDKSGNMASPVTFVSWVEVPGGVLPAGRYVLSLSGSHSKRHVVRIYDEVSGILVATLETAPEERANLSIDESIRFEQGILPNPRAVKAWFHQGSRTGEQFVYVTREHQTFFVPPAQTAFSAKP